MDTKIGKLKLTPTQKTNAAYIKLPHPFKGFSFWEDEIVVGVSEIEPTEKQKVDALKELSLIPNVDCGEIVSKKSKKERVINALKTLGLDESDIRESFGF